MDSPRSAKTPLQQQTYSLLKAMIHDGRIQPGERLLEAQVAQAFGIGRSPARNALQALLADHLVIVDERRGFRVVGESGTARLARLDPVRIAAPARWQALHDVVEQELLVQLLYRSVRINELQMAQFHGVSRTVTREVLARLHVHGLIGKDDGGHWVATQLTPARIRHLYELRWLLEPQALLLAAPAMPRAALIGARAHLVQAMAKTRVQSAAFDRVELDLHAGLLSYCPNPEILHSLARTHLLFAPTRHLFHPRLKIAASGIRNALHEHLAIIDALSDGDASQAADLLRTHLVDAVERWLARFAAASKRGGVELPPYLSES